MSYKGVPLGQPLVSNDSIPEVPVTKIDCHADAMFCLQVVSEFSKDPKPAPRPYLDVFGHVRLEDMVGTDSCTGSVGPGLILRRRHRIWTCSPGTPLNIVIDTRSNVGRRW